ncbi:hypothetical protein B0H21DRAFT_686449 [Amylocystis lapponica]|nr:hypothetical protein B0H21DRAFT_686449 [Amylocystis lapponica]
MTILLLILYALCTSCIVAKNVTIDDTYGDELTGVVPIYTPAQNWGDATCGGCLLKPDPSQAFDGTWHDSTFDAVWRPGTPTINMTFNGTASAIYVFCILGNLGPFNATTSMQLVFTLDGQPAGGFNYAPNNKSQEFMFNVPVYSNTSLAALPADTLHNLIIQSFMANLFDYAVYTWVACLFAFTEASD